MVETNNKIAIIGLGYVGLPLAVEFAKKYKTVGYDIDLERISELRLGKDKTLEIKQDDLRSVSMSDYKVFNESLVGFWATNEIIEISECNIFIVTVPTPTDKHNRPVLAPLL